MIIYNLPSVAQVFKKPSTLETILKYLMQAFLRITTIEKNEWYKTTKMKNFFILPLSPISMFETDW